MFTFNFFKALFLGLEGKVFYAVILPSVHYLKVQKLKTSGFNKVSVRNYTPIINVEYNSFNREMFSVKSILLLINLNLRWRFR